MNEKHVKIIAGNLQIEQWQVRNTLKLFEEDATIPFISRYRKEKTGSLDEVALQEIRKQAEKLTEMDDRRETILETITGLGQLSQAILGVDLPCRSRTDQDLVGWVRYQFARRFRQVRVIEEPPKESVSIQQESHHLPSQPASSSSGSGSKKASVTRPLARPGLRAVWSSMGTSRTNGRPEREMITSSPRSARSSNSDKCVLASCTFTAAMSASLVHTTNLVHLVDQVNPTAPALGGLASALAPYRPHSYTPPRTVAAPFDCSPEVLNMVDTPRYPRKQDLKPEQRRIARPIAGLALLGAIALAPKCGAMPYVDPYPYDQSQTDQVRQPDARTPRADTTTPTPDALRQDASSQDIVSPDDLADDLADITEAPDAPADSKAADAKAGSDK